MRVHNAKNGIALNNRLAPSTIVTNSRLSTWFRPRSVNYPTTTVATIAIFLLQSTDDDGRLVVAQSVLHQADPRCHAGRRKTKYRRPSPPIRVCRAPTPAHHVWGCSAAPTAEGESAVVRLGDSNMHNVTQTGNQLNR
jgi:hypothetical protein